MPRSKRSKVTTLSKTPLRTTKASKLALANEIQSELDKYDHVWVVELENMRNEGLKEIRGLWRGSGRFFFGKAKVMAKALGESAETEYAPELYKLSNRLNGQVGLFMTSYSVEETREWFEDWKRKDYARMGSIASQDVTLPAGPILTPLTEDASGDPFPHSMEPQLRNLGLSSVLVRGVPSLENRHVICRTGDKLTSEQCRLLKLLGVQMIELRMVLGDRWSKGEGFVEG